MTYDELTAASNIAAKKITPTPSSEEHWRQAAAAWHRSGFVVPAKRKYRW